VIACPHGDRMISAAVPVYRRQVGDFAYRRRNESLTVSVGPLRCLATINSAKALLVGLVVVVLVAVDEADDVGVLLDRSRLAQVGEDRALVVALLDARESCDRATIGTSRSRASTLSWREIWETSWTRFSTRRRRSSAAGSRR